MTNFPAAKLTDFVDPIAKAWKAMHPRWRLPVELGGPGGEPLPMELPDPPHWKVSAAELLKADPVQTPAPKMGRASLPIAAGDAELGPGKHLGKACPQGHRVRYDSTKQCVMCLRAAVKRSTEKRRAA